MKRFLAFSFVCLSCFVTLGCDSGNETVVMPEPTVEEEARINAEEMQNEADMEDPSMR